MNLWQPLSIPRVPAKGSVLRCTMVTSNQVTVLGNLTDPSTVMDVQLCEPLGATQGRMGDDPTGRQGSMLHLLEVFYASNGCGVGVATVP